MKFYIGTDIGGTFTDLVIIAADGAVSIVKSDTTPDDRTRGVIDALRLAAELKGITCEELVANLAYFAHGTTAATNAFIERKGSKTGLLTTQGFGDTLGIQRSMGSWAGLSWHELSHYSARTIPVPIVPRELIEEIPERIDYRGAVIAPLDRDAARRSIRRLVEQGVEAIAISLLWSFRNPAHEQALLELIAEEAPGVFVTASSALVPVLGEYERTSTTCINAYLGPVINRYLRGLERSVRDLGYRGLVSILESGGGVLPVAEAAAQAVTLLTSGPAGGVLASQRLGEALGFKNILTSDMGGTSFDVGLIVDGQPLLETKREEGRFHIALPSIKVTAIGAGGGSIARVRDGHLTVGPDSAGSMPGPACYRRGGEEPTITDADVVLGIIDAEYFLGGRMRLDVAAATQAIQRFVAEPLGFTVDEAAAGIREVANNQMADLLRRVSLRAGYDPRDFILCAYGGAGPTHAHQFAAAAGISKILVPLTASGHSAFGAVTADRRRSFSATAGLHAPPGFTRASEHMDAGRLNETFAQLTARCREALGNDARIQRHVEMRFSLQVHEIAVQVPDGELGDVEIDSLIERFAAQYESIFGKGTALRGSGVELTVLRATGTTPVYRPSAAPQKASGKKCRPIGRRKIFFYDHGRLNTAIYRSEQVTPGTRIEGPAVIERPDTTIVIGPRDVAEMEPLGNIIIEIGARG